MQVIKSRGYNKNCVLYPRPLSDRKNFCCFYMCQLWALNVVIKRQFLWPPIVMGRPSYFCPVVSSSIFYLFSSPIISAVADWMSTIPYFYTRCGPRANLECRSEMCCTRLAGNAGSKNRQKFATTWSGYIFAINALIDNGKKFKQQYLLHTFSQYREL